MATLHTAPIGVKGKISYFFRQTFRRHSGAEYSELLTRGMRGMKGINRKYPWAYLRLFSLLFVLFAAYLLIVRFTSNELFEPAITLMAGLCFNFSFLVLVYELYPSKDLPLMTVILALLLGGAGVNVVTQVLYNIFRTSDKWLSAVLSGFFEEVPKAVAAVLVILGSKKRSPLAGFVLGAAVGCGFSIIEDMGYIFLQSSGLPFMNLSNTITVSVTRGLSAVCTHTLWTAIVGWAYNYKNKLLANLAFWLTLLLSCGLHICWDLPLNPFALGFVYAACTVVIAAVSIAILTKERANVFMPKAEPVKESEEQLTIFESGECVKEGISVPVTEEKLVEQVTTTPYYFDEDALTMNASYYKFWRHWGRLCLMLGAFLMAVVGVIYCAIPYRETYGTQKFTSKQEFVAFMQDDLALAAEATRPYNPHGENSSVIKVNDVITRVTQKESDGDFVYYYEYTASYDSVSERYYYFPVSVHAEVTGEDGNTVTYAKEDLYNNGELYASFFRVTKSEVSGFNFNADGSITVFIYDPEFERDLTAWEYASFFIALGVIGAASGICFISFQLKSWRVKKLCMTKTASSAK